MGTSAEEIQVLFDADHLNELGLTPVILQQLIMYQNIVVPGGAVTADGVRYTTRAGSQITSVEELENIIVGMKQGSGILGLGGLIPSLTYLSDVAEITTHVAPRWHHPLQRAGHSLDPSDAPNRSEHSPGG